MDIPVYRLIDLARLLFFRALLLEAERRRDVSPSTSAHDTLQTARTHRRRAARRGRGVRPTGAPLSAHGFDSRQRAVDLRPMPDLCGQRARRRRLFAFDANGELIEAPTPAGDAPSSRGAARSSRGAADFSRGSVPSAAEDVDASMWAVPSSELPVPSTAEDLPFAKRAARSSRRAMHAAPFDTLFLERPMPSAAGDEHAAVCDVPSPAENLPFAKQAARSSRRAMHAVPFDTLFPERPMPSAVRDRGDSGEARYAALAKRSAQTADRLLRRVSRHRAKGK